jgi:predicted dehydrogenase
MTDKLSVGIIGCGYWGPNLIRNFSACPLTEVSAVCDANPARLESVGRTHGNLRLLSSVDQLLEQPLDAVAIATPVSTHFLLAQRCLEAGLHVLVEKPLAATAREAQVLIDLADRKERVLMVDHTYLFSPAVRRIKQLVENDELGELYYVDSVRINLGLFQRDINVIWDLAPHDLSIADYVLGYEARSISAWGCAHADPGIEDVAYVNVDYGERMLANFHVNWLSPVKMRQMIFAGSRKSLVFSELNTTEPLKIYDRGIDVAENAEQVHQLMVNYRSGDVWSPHVPPGEALQGVVTHFARCIRGEGEPVSDGRLGLRVVRQLEAATRSIRAQGGRVVLHNGTFTNGDNHARALRPDQRNSNLARRAVGGEGGDSLLREPVRLPAG